MPHAPDPDVVNVFPVSRRCGRRRHRRHRLVIAVPRDLPGESTNREPSPRRATGRPPGQPERPRV